MKTDPSFKIAVLGDGGWGTALALVLNGNGHRVSVWGPFEADIAAIRKNRVNTKFLPGVPLPETLHFTTDSAEALSDAAAVIVAVPSRYYAATLENFAAHIPADAQVISVSKGLDRVSRRRLTETAERILQQGPVTALSGPSHAEEVARGVPTAVVAGCVNTERARFCQQIFMAPTFRVYTSTDIQGVELGGALKNVIALAAGACDGLGLGDNTKAALITRGLAEMTRLGTALGAQAATFAGLSGLGDLIVTCTSRHSRNRMVGERLGRGENIEQILAGMEQVAEGVWTCNTAHDLASGLGVSVPITDEIYAVLNQGKTPHAAVRDLMMREAKPEREP